MRFTSRSVWDLIPKIRAQGLAVYSLLARHADDSGTVRLTTDDLAARCHVSVQTLTRTIQRLRQVGLVRYRRSQDTTTYHVDPSKVQHDSDSFSIR